ncbi:aminodeoxychorismate synthase [Paenibacillus sp. UMB4589-SE434]|nr:aminodeoxychorismate synthase [Paenibacillus sp. UMB4589-SE434]MDK8182747.1 aminodeoxychorismate synthase [Paenibacillus sp. UMB4589-SE434]
MRTLIIDNFDSYTYNLFQMIAEVNQEEPIVIRNNEVSWEEIQRIQYHNIVISPGPGNPTNEYDFGVCKDVIMKSKEPLLGVCLGHQGIASVSDASIIYAPEIMHGRLSEVAHNEDELFKGIPQKFNVVRYHSLVVDPRLSPSLIRTAWTSDRVIMGIRHKYKPQWGVQFHPESVSTEYGDVLLSNFRDISRRIYGASKSFFSITNDLDLGQKNEKLNHVPCTTPYYTVKYKKISQYIQPECAFAALYKDSEHSFWLDSNQLNGSMSRYTFMGTVNGSKGKIIRYNASNLEMQIDTKKGTTTISTDLFDYLKQDLETFKTTGDAPVPFNLGYVGYFGYEMKKVHAGVENSYESSMPDAMFMFIERMIAFDHIEHATYLIYLTYPHQHEEDKDWVQETELLLQQASVKGDTILPIVTPRNQQDIIFHLDRSYEEYMEDIAQIKKYLHEGDTYEINLTNELRTKIKLDPFQLYMNLRKINPAPYSAFMRFGENAILCTSPERFIAIDKHGSIEAKPIKGTIRRGSTTEEDEELKDTLLNSEKDRSENLMIVDLLRNDLGMSCEVGSIHVPKLMNVESFQTVHQLVSTIRGTIKPAVSILDCIRSAFPGGSMTGAPKLRSMEIIEQLERRPRGIYSGVLGYLSLNGTVDFNIVIRTIVAQGDNLSIGVGGAVVISSEEEKEYEEILLKAKALILSIVYTANGRSDGAGYTIIGDRDHSRDELVARYS